MVEAIAFGVGGVLLLWALATFAFAATGGPSAGLHEVAPADLSPVERTKRMFPAYQAANYLLALGVTTAAVLMVVGALVY